ncbi:winged helix-turn-helix transcriptional regulator [Microtetraspora niveoalba]|uniref:winged helix-turn-helix transcriptional regulator n=1 Tax=Microtetraspora niveoalba TaxID=46175 RepID=UPI00082FDC85|nr:helix-turn-helix domain-containing protein [Microtetraspora niveoalba]
MVTSSAARRPETPRQYDAYDPSCPSRGLFDRLSDKWVGLVVSALGDGPLRYTDLARAVAGVSQKMLTQTLRTLERDGLVSRRVTPSVPVRVDYELTPLGWTLMPLLYAVKEWAEVHMAEVESARAAYDADR